MSRCGILINSTLIVNRQSRGLGPFHGPRCRHAATGSAKNPGNGFKAGMALRSGSSVSTPSFTTGWTRRAFADTAAIPEDDTRHAHKYSSGFQIGFVQDSTWQGFIAAICRRARSARRRERLPNAGPTLHLGRATYRHLQRPILSTLHSSLTCLTVPITRSASLPFGAL